ncbi:cytochrome b subunit of the bc complex [Desulfitobacterium dichloroeliminans LMG P-21439]|uniref:Cytochrome b subunit of the bc complex n=1 Tax=Desulfitobacterium dichloroeliminans (strain LMG P-21439 / DCA1) TaxID=871963 RepID=L0F3T6_DESDL|nr:cytochrome b subunit of the bc complex [Desulfitobacterium dichloroeliminans]AGA67725.1 cytochrome b subunit of the bc complex [Desulfitobacterium dichloroeliminans LMG P-21439]
MEVDKRKTIDKNVPFFPNHLTTEVAVALAVLGLVLFMAGVMPKELGPPANPVMTPSHILPDWYFLWMFGLLQLVPQMMGLLLPAILVMGVFLLPWLDRSSSRRPEARAWIIIGTEITLILMVILSYVALHF